ncbi:hypothetical protein CMI37_15615 [Candidatus Pacearchaeota archaeon]|nr:hypothetical protein [Candidatus Pacearchaeota archaeon]
MTNFNQVKYIDQTEQRGNIHIAVHPFRVEKLAMMSWKGDYGTFVDEHPLSETQQRLADKLWEEVPGLRTLFFANGQITLQHSQVFNDTEIVESARPFIESVLNANLELETLLT